MTTAIFFHENESNLPFTIDDRVFLGEGLFETLQVIDAKPCYPEQHWQRLTKAAIYLAIPLNLSLELWIEKLNHFISKNNLRNAGIKVILAAGKAPRGLLERANDSHLVFTAFHYVKSTQPLRLISAAWQRDAKNPIYQFKSINYLEAIIARREAQAAGADDVLFFNSKNQATDTTVSNLFIIKNNCLFTPSLSSGVLPGIIRQRVMVLCNEQGIDCSEEVLVKDRLIQADAAFTSNALQGLRLIQSLDDHIFINDVLVGFLQKLLINDQNRLC
ncbi:MAG: aminotransferase class IV [Tatlockia sp.]|nr:aminotransferase class IV [Tatlockia sp.]